MYILYIPSFLFGRSLLESIKIYLYQTVYKKLHLALPNF